MPRLEVDWIKTHLAHHTHREIAHHTPPPPPLTCSSLTQLQLTFSDPENPEKIRKKNWEFKKKDIAYSLTMETQGEMALQHTKIKTIKNQSKLNMFGHRDMIQVLLQINVQFEICGPIVYPSQHNSRTQCWFGPPSATLTHHSTSINTVSTSAKYWKCRAVTETAVSQYYPSCMYDLSCSD